jgi:hypothetical protein
VDAYCAGADKTEADVQSKVPIQTYSLRPKVAQVEPTAGFQA